MTDSKTYYCYVELPAGDQNPWYPTDKLPAWPKLPDLTPYDEILDKRAEKFDELTKELLSWKSARSAWTETKDAYSIELQVPGFKRTDINIEVKDSVLTAKASRADKKYVDKTKTLSLPKDANPNEITAKLEDGILTISVAKIAPPVAKKIAIS